LPPEEKLNNFEIRILVKSTNPASSTDRADTTGSTDSTEANSTPNASQDPRNDPQQSTKRRASEEELDTRILKKLRAFLARVAKVKRVSEMDALEMGYAAAILKDGDVEVSVPIPKSYRAAINDPVYGPKWRVVI